MIDSCSGRLTIKNDPVVIGPELTKTKFLQSHIGSTARIEVSNNEWSSYRASVDINRQHFSLALYFRVEQLREIHLSLCTNQRDWDSWSKETELKKKTLHDMVLAEWLGPKPYEYKWGTVMSLYDPRSGASEILIRYNTQSENSYAS